MTTDTTIASELSRPVEGRMLAGVDAGIARYLGVDVALVRIITVAACLVGGVGLPLYAAAWLLVPDEGTGVSIATDLLSHPHNRHLGDES